MIPDLRQHVARLRQRLEGNRAYASAVATGYLQIAVGLVIQVLLVPLYLDHLGRYRFGVFAMLLSVVNLLAVGVGWLSGSSARVLAESFATSDERRFADVFTVSKWLMITYATLINLLLTAPVLLLLGTGHIRVPLEHRASVQGAVLGAGVYFLALYTLNVDRLAMAARGRQAAANGILILSQAVYAVAAVPMLVLGADLPHLMGAFVLGVGLAYLVTTRYWRRLGIRLTAFRRPRREDLAIVRTLAGRMGVGYLVFGLLTLSLQSDIFLVGWLAGPATAATFVLVWRPAEFVINALRRLPDSAQPFIMHMDARGESARLVSNYRRGVGFVAAIAAVAAVGYALFGKWAVRLWVGPEEAPTELIAYVLAGGAILWLSSAHVPAVYAFATVRLRWMVSAMAAELALKVLLLVVLLPRFGFWTPMLAINVIHGAGFSFLYYVLGRRAAQGTSAESEVVGPAGDRATR